MSVFMRTVTADASGGSTAMQLYKAWGEVRTGSVNALATRYTFTGQAAEDSLGLLFYHARWYDPALSRFIQPDTIVPISTQGVQAWDRYAYANNNSIRYNDPTGHCLMLCTAAIGAGIGAIVGAVTYTLANQNSFDTGEMLVAAGAGAIAGALIGSGVGILAAPATTAAIITTATAMVGAGTGAAGSAVGYTVTNTDMFETTPFVETAAVGGAVGGISAVTPVSSMGVAIKATTYIAGSESLYALQTDNWTVEGAQTAAVYGMIGAGADVGGSLLVGGNPSILANLNPSTRSLGYLPTPNYYDIMTSAAHLRWGSGAINASTSWISGSSASITTTLLDRKLRYEER